MSSIPTNSIRRFLSKALSRNWFSHTVLMKGELQLLRSQSWRPFFLILILIFYPNANNSLHVTKARQISIPYGRTQSLIMPRYKLFFPKFANKPLHCVLKDDADLMLYNGVAFVSDDIEKLQVLKSVLDSDLFWNYLVKNAKPYSTGYYSLSGVDIKNFCIPTIKKEMWHSIKKL